MKYGLYIKAAFRRLCNTIAEKIKDYATLSGGILPGTEPPGEWHYAYFCTSKRYRLNAVESKVR